MLVKLLGFVSIDQNTNFSNFVPNDSNNVEFSDGGAYAPEKNIFAMLQNISAVLSEFHPAF